MGRAGSLRSASGRESASGAGRALEAAAGAETEAKRFASPA